MNSFIKIKLGFSQQEHLHIFHYQCDINNYTYQVFNFLLFDNHEYTHGIFLSVFLVSIFMLLVYVTFFVSLKIRLTEFYWKIYIFSDENKQSLLELCCMYLKGEIMAESIYVIEYQLTISILLKGWLCHSILQTRQISHLHGLALFTTALRNPSEQQVQWNLCRLTIYLCLFFFKICYLFFFFLLLIAKWQDDKLTRPCII